MTCPGVNEALSRFNRDTRWVAAGLLVFLLLAALAFEVLVQERRPMTAGLFERASQNNSGSSRTADASTLLRSTDLSANISTSAVTSVALPLVDQRSSESSSRESHGRTGTAGGSTPPPVLVLSPEITQTGARTNKSEWSLAHQPDSAPSIRGKTLYKRHRSAGQLGYAEVKRRLLELWHRSLAKSEKSQFWPIFSKLDKRKKAASTGGRGTLTPLRHWYWP
jgi:hypothetical protein